MDRKAELVCVMKRSVLDNRSLIEGVYIGHFSILEIHNLIRVDLHGV